VPLCLQAGAEEIKKHPWFDSINFALLRHQTPPYVPRKAQQAAAAAAAVAAGGGTGKTGSVDSAGSQGGAGAFDNY
jgi:hypothetical protein